MSTVQYVQQSELPSLTISWFDSDGDVIDFATGWTFELRIAATPVVTKTTGITGAATDPNLTVSWAAGELDAIATGTYAAQLWARRTSDSKDRVLPFGISITKAIT